MRQNTMLDHFLRRPLAPAIPGALYRLSPASRRGNPDPGEPASGPGKAERDDLPYRVEMWDETRNSVEQVLAVTANSSIGFAAFYAATREFPDRYITLRHNNSIVSRWNAPRH
jgi:hypothetical protein